MSASTLSPAAPVSPFWHNLRRNAPVLTVYALLLVMFIVAALIGERFLTSRNLIYVLRQAAFLGTVALG